MNILYIHGANASPHSFAFIQANLPEHQDYWFSYITDWPIEEIISDAVEYAKTLPQDLIIVGHSLGGVIAVAVSQDIPERIKHVVTLSAPFGGSEAATALRMLMPTHQLFKNISVYNPTLAAIRGVGAVVPTTQFVTLAGDLHTKYAGDGVVSASSQRSLEGGVRHDIHVNHFEILLHPTPVDVIAGILKEPNHI